MTPSDTGLFTDISKVNLLVNTLFATNKDGILLQDAYYWLDINGSRNEKIDNTLSLLEEANVLKIKNHKVYLSEDFVVAAQSHSVENILRTFVLYSLSDGLLEEIFKNRYLINGTKLAIKVNSISPMYVETRNLLINIGGFIQNSDTLICTNVFENVLKEKGYAYFFNDTDRIVSESELYSQLARKSELGKIAEEIAYEYEVERLGDFGQRPVMVARINVAAGYDIKSFDSNKSQDFDRYIEVKSFNSNRFFITDNEISMSKKYKTRYWLYLVNTTTKNVEMINNPAEVLDFNTAWTKNVKVIEYKRDKIGLNN